MSVKTITGSALLLAIALLSQGFLRMIIPVHGLVQFLVGSIVGACTALATWRYGLWSGFVVACVTPLMAFVQGMLTIPVFVPVVAVGSMAYAVTVKMLGQKRIWVTAIVAAIIKSVVLYALFFELFQLLPTGADGSPAIDEKLQKGILFSMGWPQLITGTCGIFLADFIAKRGGIKLQKQD